MIGKIEISRELIERISARLERLNAGDAELRALLAAPVVERQPVAWEVYWADNGDYYFTSRKCERAAKLLSDPDFMVVPLYAEPPAPVAVVLPEREHVHSKTLPFRAAAIADGYISGWNACLDKVKELNQ